MEESEFGKGLVICLVKFAEHRWRWEEQKELYEDMRKHHPDTFSISDAVEMHFNGASDHLFEIEVPPEWEETNIGKRVEELKSFGLKMGHSFSGVSWTEADVTKAYAMCQEIARLIDEKLGLIPEVGRW